MKAKLIIDGIEHEIEGPCMIALLSSGYKKVFPYPEGETQIFQRFPNGWEIHAEGYGTIKEL